MAGRAPRHPRAEPGGGPTRAGTTRRRGGRRPRPSRRRRADERRRSGPMNGLRKMTSGLPTFPILVMFGLFFFDEWDTAAFNVLAPNIQHAFHLSDRGFGFLVISNLSIVLLAAVPLGYYGEPLRGQTDDAESAEAAIAEAPVPFGEARRTLFAVPTLRRQFTAFFFIGAGLIPLAFYVPIYLERVFHVGPFGRGVAVSINGAAAFAGVLASGRWTRRWIQRDLGEPIKWAGISLVGVGFGIVVICALPNLYAVVAMSAVTSFAGGILPPPCVRPPA